MMEKETYEKIFEMIGTNSENAGLWSVMSKLITICTAVCYGATLLGRVLLSQWTKLGVLVLVPAISFAAVSVFRKKYNAARPYEMYDFKPLIQKETKGKSFPSRHVFSVFVIAVSVAGFYPEACVGLCLAGFFLAFIRVVTGVHFPRDVIAGAVMGVFFGVLANVLYFIL